MVSVQKANEWKRGARRGRGEDEGQGARAIITEHPSGRREGGGGAHETTQAQETAKNIEEQERR